MGGPGVSREGSRVGFWGRLGRHGNNNSGQYSVSLGLAPMSSSWHRVAPAATDNAWLLRLSVGTTRVGAETGLARAMLAGWATPYAALQQSHNFPPGVVRGVMVARW